MKVSREQMLVGYIQSTTDWREVVSETFGRFACDNESTVVTESINSLAPHYKNQYRAWGVDFHEVANVIVGDWYWG